MKSSMAEASVESGDLASIGISCQRATFTCWSKQTGRWIAKKLAEFSQWFGSSRIRIQRYKITDKMKGKAEFIQQFFFSRRKWYFTSLNLNKSRCRCLLTVTSSLNSYLFLTFKIKRCFKNLAILLTWIRIDQINFVDPDPYPDPATINPDPHYWIFHNLAVKC